MKTFPIYETGRIRAILDRAPVCFAAVVDAEGAPYAFPMNFGYDGRFFYLHSGPEHSALPLLRRDGRICLTLSVRNELMFQDEAVGCSYRMKAESVVVRGTECAVIGDPQPYTAENVPGAWNMNVEVERVDG